VVFIGIAILVYHFFIKALGIFLFVVELWWFIALPLYREAGAWFARREKIAGQSNSRRRAARSLVVLCGVIVLLSVPWPGRVVTSGLLRPLEVWPIIVPSGAFIERFDLHNAERVDAGVALALFRSPELSTRQTIAGLRAESARWLAASSGLDDEARKQLIVAQQNWATAEAEFGVAVEQMQKLNPIAPFAGTFYSADPDIAAGQWLAANEQLGVLVGDSGYIVETLLDEEQVKRVAVGDSGLFLADGLEGGVVALEVTRIDVDASRTLTIGELAAGAGGHVMTRPQQNVQVPERAVYRVELALTEGSAELAGHQWRGEVVIRASSEAPLARYLRSAVVVLVREFGF